MTATQRLRRDGVLWQEVDGQIVVLDADKSFFLAVNSAGAVLWQALAEGCSTDHLAEILVQRFGIDEGQVASDVRRFIADLDRRNLLEGSEV